MKQGVRSTALVVFAMVLGVVLAGCPKRPATTLSAAPSPGGAGPAATSPGQPAPGPSTGTAGAATSPGAAPGAGAAPARPSEYSVNEALKDIHFDFDKYAIRPADARLLEANATWLRAHGQYVLLIEGHCDERGTIEYNLALGERRAKATMDYLVAQGVQASRITVISYGEERPLCTVHGDSCWAQNRRAHLLVKER